MTPGPALRGFVFVFSLSCLDSCTFRDKGVPSEAGSGVTLRWKHQGTCTFCDRGVLSAAIQPAEECAMAAVATVTAYDLAVTAPAARRSRSAPPPRRINGVPVYEQEFWTSKQLQ